MTLPHLISAKSFTPYYEIDTKEESYISVTLAEFERPYSNTETVTDSFEIEDPWE